MYSYVWNLLCPPLYLNIFSIIKNTVSHSCIAFPCIPSFYHQQHLNPFDPSSASSHSHLSAFISLFIHLSTINTVFLLTPHLHLPHCRAPGAQRPSTHDGFAPIAKMTNNPCRARGCKVEAQRCTVCWVGFPCLMLFLYSDSVVIKSTVLEVEHFWPEQDS